MRRRRWIIVAVTIAALSVAALVAIATRIPFSSDALRARVVAALADRLDAEVELDALTLRIYPRLHASGERLTLRFMNRHDIPPLVAIDRFDIDADLVGLWRRHVAHVKLEGLVINVPPDQPDHEPPPDAPAATPTAATPAQSDTPREPADTEAPQPMSARDVVIDDLEAPNSVLVILRREADKPARTWRMHHLRLRNVGVGTKMPFDTALDNAVPPGEITASGMFGPWMRTDPGASPLEGRFTFDRADLGVFKGISGILSARGTFGGTLDRIAVDGQTDTPNFMVRISGHEVPLRTTYHAVVDGTNGNTTLDPVDATVLNTRIVARGGVYEVEGAHGRIVTLDVRIDDGRLEDIMRMAVSTARPPMVGGLALQTTMAIPPGDADVVDKLKLDGRFALNDGRFTDAGVQAKINQLSLRASGNLDQDGQPARVVSDFSGRFKLGGGQLSLSTLTFNVPGAVVQLSGGYHLRRETLAFSGNLYMDAKLSQTVTGFKSLLLKVADPLFRKNGRTVVPLKIGGTRNDPQFGLDIKRVFKRSPTTPPPPARRPAAPTAR